VRIERDGTVLYTNTSDNIDHQKDAKADRVIVFDNTGNLIVMKHRLGYRGKVALNAYGLITRLVDAVQALKQSTTSGNSRAAYNKVLRLLAEELAE